jgi:hypothetical protein
VNSDLRGQGAQRERKETDLEEALQYLLITNYLRHLSSILVGPRAAASGNVGTQTIVRTHRYSWPSLQYLENVSFLDPARSSFSSARVFCLFSYLSIMDPVA